MSSCNLVGQICDAILCMFKFDRSHITFYNTKHFFTALLLLFFEIRLEVPLTISRTCNWSDKFTIGQVLEYLSTRVPEYDEIATQRRRCNIILARAARKQSACTGIQTTAVSRVTSFCVLFSVILFSYLLLN